ncbi:MAG: hypothetical protein AAGF95_06780 [Chloroflexota bacterium]
MQRYYHAGIALAIALFIGGGIFVPKSVSAAEPPPTPHCGPDQINVSGNAVVSEGLMDIEYIMPGPYQMEDTAPNKGADPEWFDSFTLTNQTAGCGFREFVSSYTNNTSLTQEHVFVQEATAATTYSVGVNGGFATGFEASMGFEAQATETERYRNKVRVLPGKTVTLEASPSLDIYTGDWSCFLCSTQSVEVIRPNGHFSWFADET